MFHWDLVNFVLYQEFSGHVFFIYLIILSHLKNWKKTTTTNNILFPLIFSLIFFCYVFSFFSFSFIQDWFWIWRKNFHRCWKSWSRTSKTKFILYFLLYFLLLNIHRILLLKRDPWMWICFYQTLSFSLYLSLLNLSRKTTDKVVLIQRGIVHSLSLMKN